MECQNRSCHVVTLDTCIGSGKGKGKGKAHALAMLAMAKGKGKCKPDESEKASPKEPKRRSKSNANLDSLETKEYVEQSQVPITEDKKKKKRPSESRPTDAVVDKEETMRTKKVKGQNKEEPLRSAVGLEDHIPEDEEEQDTGKAGKAVSPGETTEAKKDTKPTETGSKKRGEAKDAGAVTKDQKKPKAGDLSIYWRCTGVGINVIVEHHWTY